MDGWTDLAGWLAGWLAARVNESNSKTLSRFYA